MFLLWKDGSPAGELPIQAYTIRAGKDQVDKDEGDSVD